MTSNPIIIFPKYCWGLALGGVSWELWLLKGIKTCICVYHPFKAPHAACSARARQWQWDQWGGNRRQSTNIGSLHSTDPTSESCSFYSRRTSPGRLSRQQWGHIVSHYLRHRNSMYVCACWIKAEEASHDPPWREKAENFKFLSHSCPYVERPFLLLLAWVAISVSSSALITDPGLRLKQWVYFRTLWHSHSLKSLCSTITVQYKYKKIMGYFLLFITTSFSWKWANPEILICFNPVIELF